ncbi:MAG: hypothetical protein O6949_01180 [Chloroflexi bacterium]|nr:hypothetical protein [Chloroflexota bacterium]
MAEQTSRARYWLSGIITGLALALAAVHLLVPDIKIDAITIALLILAMAPWLAPLLKTIELPGGWKFEFRELKEKVEQELRDNVQQVRNIAERVEEIAQFAITGAAPALLKDRLARELSEYRNYMIALGVDLIGEPPPTVEIREDYDNAHYDSAKNEIVAGPHFASSDVLFREYSHHVLDKVRGQIGLVGAQQDAVESGLADYFPCSYRDDPELGREVAAYLRGSIGFDKMAIRDLKNEMRLTDLDAPHIVQAAGEVWGGAFWEVRELLGKHTADQLLLKAWAEVPASANAEPLFVQRIAELAGAQKQGVLAVFERRSLAH